MRRERGIHESVGSIILGFEFVVIGLGSLVAFGLKVASPAWLALLVGGAFVLLMLATIPLLGRRWGIGVGWVLQILAVLSGFLVPMMFVVGLIFLAIWAYAMYAASRAAAQRAAYAASDTPDTQASPETHPNRTEN